MNHLKIVSSGKNKIWFTSDLHFYHNNILKYCNRPFQDINDMTTQLINNWNEVVCNEDAVFILGDFVWGNDPIKIKNIINQLNGKNLYFLMGNHDNVHSYPNIDSRIKVFCDIAHIKVKYQDLKAASSVELCLSHYPLATWEGRQRGCINLHGHIHSKEGETGFEGIEKIWPGRSYDVGVDANNYKPIELNKILLLLEDEYNKSKEPKVDLTKVVLKYNSEQDTYDIGLSTHVKEIDDFVKTGVCYSKRHICDIYKAAGNFMFMIENLIYNHKCDIMENGGPWYKTIITEEQINKIEAFCMNIVK